MPIAFATFPNSTPTGATLPNAITIVKTAEYFLGKWSKDKLREIVPDKEQRKSLLRELKILKSVDESEWQNCRKKLALTPLPHQAPFGEECAECIAKIFKPINKQQSSEQETIMGKVMGKIAVALKESFSNHLMHGHRYNPMKQIEIHVAYLSSGEGKGITGMIVSSSDRGAGFDREKVRDTTFDENLEIPCGRGLLLIELHGSNVSYQDGGRTCTIEFDLVKMIEAAEAIKRKYEQAKAKKTT